MRRHCRKGDRRHGTGHPPRVVGLRRPLDSALGSIGWRVGSARSRGIARAAPFDPCWGVSLCWFGVSSALLAQRAGSRCGSRRYTSPGRVPPEVGSGRSCVRSVRGHTPLQVSLDGKPGAHEAPSWRARCPDGEASHRHRRPGETGRRRYRQSAHLRPRARTAGMTRQSAHALDRLRAFCRGRAFRYLTQLTRRNRAREGWPCEPTRPTRSSVLSRGDRVPGDIAMSACDARSRRAAECQTCLGGITAAGACG